VALAVATGVVVWAKAGCQNSPVKKQTKSSKFFMVTGKFNQNKDKGVF
jgi:hypothetical protein